MQQNEEVDVKKKPFRFRIVEDVNLLTEVVANNLYQTEKNGPIWGAIAEKLQAI